MHILVLPGDGIGPEISAATVEVVKAAAAIAGFSPAFSTVLELTALMVWFSSVPSPSSCERRMVGLPPIDE